MGDTLMQTEEEAAVERIVRNQLEIKRLEEENATLKGYFKQSPEVYKTGSYKEVGKFYIRVSANTRMDDALAKRLLTPTEYNRVSKVVLDTSKAKAILNAKRQADITKTYENRIEVGLR